MLLIVVRAVCCVGQLSQVRVRLGGGGYDMWVNRLGGGFYHDSYGGMGIVLSLSIFPSRSFFLYFGREKKRETSVELRRCFCRDEELRIPVEWIQIFKREASEKGGFIQLVWLLETCGLGGLLIKKHL